MKRVREIVVSNVEIEDKFSWWFNTNDSQLYHFTLGKWSTLFGTASPTQDGLMSKEDKEVLISLSMGSSVVTVPTYADLESYAVKSEVILYVVKATNKIYRFSNNKPIEINTFYFNSLEDVKNLLGIGVYYVVVEQETYILYISLVGSQLTYILHSPKKYIECSYNTINSEWSDWVTTSYDAAGAILDIQNWVTAQVTLQNAALSSMQEQITTIANSSTSNFNILYSSLNSLSLDVTNVKNNITTVNDKISQTDNTINALIQYYNTLNNKIFNLENNYALKIWVDGNFATINNLNIASNQINTNSLNIQGLTSRVVTLEEAVAALLDISSSYMLKSEADITYATIAALTSLEEQTLYNSDLINLHSILISNLQNNNITLTDLDTINTQIAGLVSNINSLYEIFATKTALTTTNNNLADLETRVVVLEDNKADMATTLLGYGITDAYTKVEVDAKVSSVYNYKGTIADHATLLTLTNMLVGDVYNLISTGENFSWTGSAWESLAGTIDLSAYLEKTEAATIYETKSNVAALLVTTNANTSAITDIQNSQLEIEEAVSGLTTALDTFLTKVDATTLYTTNTLFNATADQVILNTSAISSLLTLKADKATTLSGYGITDAYTKTEIDNKISAVFRYKGNVATHAALTALTGMVVGDVYNVTETGDNYAWTGIEWDKLSGEIDLSAYLTINSASNTYETIANVQTLSNTVSGHTEAIESLEVNKANTSHTHIKSEVGLANVDNTSDLLKPISNATQTALNSKANTVHTHTKSEVGLSNVDNTSDLTKPISTATQIALNSKADKADTLSGYGITDAEPAIVKLTAFNKDFGTTAGTVTQGNDSRILNGQTAFWWGDHASAGYASNSSLTAHINKIDNPHEVTKSQVGLSNVDNTSDANKPVSTAQQTAINSGVVEAKTYADEKSALAIPLTQKGAASGVAELDASGKVLSSQLPSYVDDVLNYTTQSEFPATGESGKIYITEDTNKTYRWTGSAYIEISPSIALGATSSTAYRGDHGLIAYNHSQAEHQTIINGTGFIKANGKTLSYDNSSYSLSSHTHTKSEIGLANVDNTSDAAKPVSTATQTALNSKANTVHIHTKSEVGLANVDNTSDLLKPISTATQTALNSKANISHTHTKSEVGLANVDNTSDVNKPVSNATQFALNSKANTVHTHNASDINAGDMSLDRLSLMKKYVASRGENLVTNGTGLLKNNTNFSKMTYSGAESYNCDGSFTTASGSWIKLDELMPVNPDLAYKLLYYIKAKPWVGASVLAGVACFDTDGLEIMPSMTMYVPNTLTTLALDLKDGDTTVKFTNLTNNWVNVAGAGTHIRTLIFWNYIDSYGKIYPELSYSRNSFLNSWDPGAVNYATNTITLNKPWSNGTIVAGTKVSNGNDGNTYKYLGVNNYKPTTEWTAQQDIISGIDLSGNNYAKFFHPGTASVKLVFMVNRDVTGGQHYISNISFGVDAVTTSAMASHVASNLHLTEGQRTKLEGIAAGAEVNVNADWNAATGDAQILNKPTSMPASDVSAWAKAATKPSYVASDIGGLGTNYRWLTDTYINTWNAKEPAITKLTAFNKDFGTTAGTISEGNHAHTFASLTSKPNTLSGYGITDVPSDNKTYGRKDGTWSEITTSGGGGTSTISITWSALKSLRDAGTLVPGQVYRITDYVCTTTTNDSKAVNNLFDIVITALDEGHLSENANVIYHESDTYFENAKLEVWEIKYCIDNDTSRFAWANTTTGKGVIYYMKDEWNNECPYDFKNIQFKKSSVFLYTFGGTTDNSLTGGCHHNTMMNYVSSSVLRLNFNTFGNNCSSNTFGDSCYSNTFGDFCNYNTFGNECNYNTFGNGCNSNTFGNGCYSNTFGDDCNSNTFGDYCGGNTFGNGCYSNKFGDYCLSNTFGYNCNSNTFGDYCNSNTFGDDCNSNTFGYNCYSNNFYVGTSGTTKKDHIRYIVLEDGCTMNNFYSNLTTSDTSYLQRIRIKGLENTTPTNIQITLSAINTKYEWVICYTSGNVLKQYCPDD